MWLLRFELRLYAEKRVKCLTITRIMTITNLATARIAETTIRITARTTISTTIRIIIRTIARKTTRTTEIRSFNRRSCLIRRIA